VEGSGPRSQGHVGLGQDARGYRDGFVHTPPCSPMNLNVHESQIFANVWNKLPANVVSKRPSQTQRTNARSAWPRLAARCRTVAWHQEECQHLSRPETNYGEMVSFWQHWLNRVASLYGKRDHAERYSRYSKWLVRPPQLVSFRHMAVACGPIVPSPIPYRRRYYPPLIGESSLLLCLILFTLSAIVNGNISR
jgi:hypothetical protein